VVSFVNKHHGLEHLALGIDGCFPRGIH
jgi:hypothetical protein